MSESKVLSVICVLTLLAGCGQRGELYLPEKSGEVVTRPTQAPDQQSGQPSNSPQTVDSPAAPASPAPEVTRPEPESEKDKQKKDGASPPSP
jgi:predicted small lipoprotein YifL